jgi:hypothetical protein
VSISSWLGRLMAVAATCASANAGCGAESGDCVRYSDCADGLTCAAGKCVVPPAPPSSSGGNSSSSSSMTSSGGIEAGSEASGDEAGNGLTFGDDASTPGATAD